MNISKRDVGAGARLCACFSAPLICILCGVSVYNLEIFEPKAPWCQCSCATKSDKAIVPII